MAYHLGIGSLPGSHLFPVPATPGYGLGSPIPPLYEDADHAKGFQLDPRGSSAGTRRRASWNLATGELARLLSMRR
jgi:hypothetical protein